MKRIRVLSGKEIALYFYEFSLPQSIETAARWIAAIADETEDITLVNNSDITEDGGSSCHLPPNGNLVDAIKRRQANSLLTYFTLDECRVSVALHLQTYLVTVGIDKENRTLIDRVEAIIDKNEGRMFHDNSRCL